MAIDIEQINAVSHQHFVNYITDNVFQENALLELMQKKNHVSFSGGTKLHVPIRYQELGQAAMIDPDATRRTVVVESRTALELNWKFGVCDCIMTWEELVFNGRSGRIADLMADKAEEGLQDLSKLVSDQFYQAYTDKGTYDMDGFHSCVRGAATSYGGLSDSDASIWAPGFRDTTTAAMALFGNSGSLEYGLRSCYFKGYPDLLVTTLLLAGVYSSKLNPGERRSPNTKEVGQAGAIPTDLYFMGVPILADPQCLDDHLLVLSTENLFFFLHEGDALDVGKWKDDNPDNYKSLRSLITLCGNWAFTLRRGFGEFTNLTS